MIPVKTKHIKKYAPPFPAAPPASPPLPRPAIAGAARGAGHIPVVFWPLGTHFA